MVPVLLMVISKLDLNIKYLRILETNMSTGVKLIFVRLPDVPSCLLQTAYSRYASVFLLYRKKDLNSS